MRVYQNRARFDASHKFSTWLTLSPPTSSKVATATARASASVAGRRKRSYRRASGRAWRRTNRHPASHCKGAERAEAVRNAVGQLPEELRTPLILSEYLELSHAEIGAIRLALQRRWRRGLLRPKTLARKPGWLLKSYA